MNKKQNQNVFFNKKEATISWQVSADARFNTGPSIKVFVLLALPSGVEYRIFFYTGQSPQIFISGTSQAV